MSEQETKRVKRIRIRNILGIDELEIEPGSVTLVEGANASGKTSVLEAIKSVIRGGHDATLKRKGAEEGEVVFVLEDDIEITKRVSSERSDLKVKHPTMGTVSAAQTFVDGLTDKLSVNPVEFLTSRDRVEILLEALAVDLDESGLREALAPVSEEASDEVDVERVVDAASGRDALEAIEAVRKVVYDRRTEVNRVARDKSTTAKELRDSLPEGDASPEELEDELREKERAHREAEKALTRHVEEVNATLERELSEIKEERDARVRELQEEIRKVENSAQEDMERVRKAAESEKEDLQIEGRPEVNRLGSEVAALRERTKAAEKASNTRRMIAEAKEAASVAERKSEAMTEAISRLDALKGRLLEDLPIEGAEIKDGELHVDGVPFERLNSARQVQVAVEVAKLRAGSLGLVCVDNMELLDEETFAEFRKALEDSGLQAVVTRVTEGPLTVSTNGGGDGR